MKKCPVILIAVLFLPLTVVQSDAAMRNAPAPDFALTDQRDQLFHLREAVGKVVILLAADKESEAETSRWRRMLVDRYQGAICMIGVADLRAVPFFMKKIALLHFKKDNARILMDWRGEVVTRYGLPEKIPNIVVIDKKGIVRYLYSGEAKQPAVDRLCSEIDHWNKETHFRR